MRRSRLPVGIPVFRKLRERGLHYVDKTGWAQRMVEEGDYYFLSRPRRFGKSLFLDTLDELFSGSEELFRGLAIHPHWDWSVRHPVVRLDFGGGEFTKPGGLHTHVMAQLAAAERRGGVTTTETDAPQRLAELLEVLHEHTGSHVVVLVDEYDKPILDALETPELARANRDAMRALYGTLKASDAHIRFVFLTGVSRFSKAGVFSGLNNLEDISLNPQYSEICGYTEADLDQTFGEELEGLDRDLVREWYNGYNWLGEHKVYNPYDVLLFLKNRTFEAWWFNTGTPTFLVDMLLRRGVPSVRVEGMLVDDGILNRLDVGDLPVATLLFQTGYLTIVGHEQVGGAASYTLGFPNREVRQSFNKSLLSLLYERSALEIPDARPLLKVLQRNDFAGLETLLRAHFAGIPYEWYTNNRLARYEGHYATALYSYFTSAGLRVTAEESSSKGRLDMAVRFKGNVYLFEFKVVERAGKGAALAQLKDREYADKYRDLGEPIHLIGVEFSAEKRNLTAFEVETVASG